jgi:hypothetical protein
MRNLEYVQKSYFTYYVREKRYFGLDEVDVRRPFRACKRAANGSDAAAEQQHSIPPSVWRRCEKHMHNKGSNEDQHVEHANACRRCLGRDILGRQQDSFS